MSELVVVFMVLVFCIGISVLMKDVLDHAKKVVQQKNPTDLLCRQLILTLALLRESRDVGCGEGLGTAPHRIYELPATSRRLPTAGSW